MICINKIDLVSPADLQPLVGVFSRMGYAVLLVSATPAKASNGCASELAAGPV